MNKNSTKILIIDDNEDILLAAKLLLKSYANIIHTENDPAIIPHLLKAETYDVIVLDMNFTRDMTSGAEGLYWLKEILKIDPLAVVILITAYGDIETAVKAVKLGATDFVLKPWHNEKLIATLNSAIRLRESRVELEKLRLQNNQLNTDLNSIFPELIGISEGMKKVFKTINKVAGTDANVLILGENGTGKELVARAIHKNSNRSNEIFMSVDLGAITKSLFESELFGHVKGSFTDARENRAGRFELANNGTLFLDEIGNLELDMQSKLLSVIEKREVIRVGASSAKPFNIRLICATNRNINEMVSENYFRQDLLYRINTVVIHIPPLRERVEDIMLLTEFYLNQYKKKYNKPEIQIIPSALRQLQLYNWPGNVRELQHIIERAIILSETNELTPNDFILSPGNENKLTTQNNNLAEIEKSVIKEAIENNNGNITNAAKELGLTRTSLYRRISKYNLGLNRDEKF